jgi:alginate O-acetyltransferase complex protein AlgJ
MSRKRELLSGCLFTALMGVACAASFSDFRQAVANIETPSAEDMLEGKWSPQFEKSFREALPVSAISRNLWGRIEYTLFRQGHKGVIVGAEGWLFTDEEFSCPPQHQKNLAENIAYINNAQKIFAQKNTKLAIVLVPAKARILSEALPENLLPGCRENLYKDTLISLKASGIEVADLFTAMRASPQRETLYLKTDTHWSPAGAELAAEETAKLVRASFRELDLPETRYSARSGGIKDIPGDLASYIPGIVFPSNRIAGYVSGVSVASADPSQQGLFDDAAPPVALVGTSYSANPNWNFEGFAKRALKTDILNMADQGLGPFVVMDKYLQSDMWKNTPPRLIVWEIPERYLLMPHGVAG